MFGHVYTHHVHIIPHITSTCIITNSLLLCLLSQVCLPVKPDNLLVVMVTLYNVQHLACIVAQAMLLRVMAYNLIYEF